MLERRRKLDTSARALFSTLLHPQNALLVHLTHESDARSAFLGTILLVGES